MDIKNLTREQAVEIYRRDYWDAVGASTFPPAIAVVAFDCAVNQGKSRAIGILEEAQDLEDFMARRALAYAKLPTFARFGRGWMRRLFNVYKFALKV